ncbi:uncharacterized protein [Euphorbia lathyris]|uniref:uncharacterized protein isoform X2 n=1 Tax=Euphorbia lathyris TaxID=212925 RepID=UPI003313ADCB
MCEASQGHYQSLLNIQTGTMMDQVPDKHRERIVKSIAIFKDPLRWVICDAYTPAGKPICLEWSVAQFRLPEGVQHFVAFGHQKNTVVIIGMDGSFYRCEFDPAFGGEMNQLEHHNFLQRLRSGENCPK